MQNVRQGILHVHNSSLCKSHKFLVLLCMHVNVQVTKMPKGKRLGLQSKEVVNKVFEYFLKQKERCAGKGALSRTSEATGL